jgi:hypothetical protein
MLRLVDAQIEVKISNSLAKFPHIRQKKGIFQPIFDILALLPKEYQEKEHQLIYFSDSFVSVYARTNDKGEADLADLEDIYHTLLQFFGYKKSSKPSTYSIRYEKELAEIAANFWKNIPQEYHNKPFFWLNSPILTLTYRYKGQCNLQFERKLLTKQFPKAMLCVTCFEADSK